MYSSVASKGNKDRPTSLSKFNGEVDSTLHCITNVSDFLTIFIKGEKYCCSVCVDIGLETVFYI